MSRRYKKDFIKFFNQCQDIFKIGDVAAVIYDYYYDPLIVYYVKSGVGIGRLICHNQDNHIKTRIIKQVDIGEGICDISGEYLLMSCWGYKKVNKVFTNDSSKRCIIKYHIPTGELTRLVIGERYSWRIRALFMFNNVVYALVNEYGICQYDEKTKSIRTLVGINQVHWSYCLVNDELYFIAQNNYMENNIELRVYNFTTKESTLVKTFNENINAIIKISNDNSRLLLVVPSGFYLYNTLTHELNHLRHKIPYDFNVLGFKYYENILYAFKDDRHDCISEILYLRRPFEDNEWKQIKECPDEVKFFV